MRASFLALFLLLAAPAHALVLDTPLADRAQEQTAQDLFHALKCVVCEGQSLAESDAAFAQQMRSRIRRMVSAGDSDATIRQYFAERYGDHILLSPPLAKRTALLWAMPMLLVLVGGFILWRSTRHALKESV